MYCLPFLAVLGCIIAHMFNLPVFRQLFKDIFINTMFQAKVYKIITGIMLPSIHFLIHKILYSILCGPSPLFSGPNPFFSDPSSLLSGPSPLLNGPSSLLSDPSTLLSSLKTLLNCLNTLLSYPSSLLNGPSSLLSGPNPFFQWSEFLTQWSEFLIQWSNFFTQWSNSLSQWSDFLTQWSEFLTQWSEFLFIWLSGRDMLTPGFSKSFLILNYLFNKRILCACCDGGCGRSLSNYIPCDNDIYCWSLFLDGYLILWSDSSILNVTHNFFWEL